VQVQRIADSDAEAAERRLTIAGSTDGSANSGRTGQEGAAATNEPSLHNFCAGPAALPTPVLERAAGEMLDWHGTGMSFMEMSHRSRRWWGSWRRPRRAARLLGISDDFAVLFLQGGASTQFAAVPLNLAASGGPFAYATPGSGRARPWPEGSATARCGRGGPRGRRLPRAVPPRADWQVPETPAFLHITPNETIDGIEFHWTPEPGAPLVADMSSTLLSRPIDGR
jgi:phosphoserine aminotransferase